jgi:hypothetical protein
VIWNGGGGKLIYVCKTYGKGMLRPSDWAVKCTGKDVIIIRMGIEHGMNNGLIGCFRCCMWEALRVDGDEMNTRVK